MAARICIDGQLLEGGGQIIRMSMGFSALLGSPIQVHSIRAKRSKPGLKAQHLSGLLLAKEIAGGQIQGALMNSNEISFTPNPRGGLRGGRFAADTKTAGATSLLAQVSLPLLLFADTPSSVELRGGTNADMAPTMDFYDQVFRPNLSRFGADFEVDVRKKGYFPKGGGHVLIHVAQPIRELAPVELTEPGTIETIRIEASVAGTLPLSVANEMAQAAEKLIRQTLGDPSKVKEPSATGNGSSILLVARSSSGCILGGSAIGSPKVKPWKTGQKAAESLLASVTTPVCVDQFIQDQLVLFMALAKGRSRILTGPLELHTRTAIWISEQLSHAKFTIHERDDQTNIIECEGIAFSPPSSST
eukprot:snap_masked-scaffold10_size831480-processed-gene-7.2 protein:Tk01842 transcript:snap_masked-scaffold10_size831480-processed-gene-7.2-mRNA-1 annotation:"rna 3 -terminal phosphate cyclase-like"